MTATQIIVIAVVLAIVVALAAGWRSAGPRVTTIETRREHEEDHKDQTGDGGSDS